MTANLSTDYVNRVTAELARLGYVVLKLKSHRAAQERHRIAHVRMRDAHEARDKQQAWLERDIFPWQRHLTQRVDHLAGLAARLGATPEQMASPSCPCGLPQCLVTASQADKQPHPDVMATSAHLPPPAYSVGFAPSCDGSPTTPEEGR